MKKHITLMDEVVSKDYCTLEGNSSSNLLSKKDSGFNTKIIVQSKTPGGEISTKEYRNKTALYGRMKLLEDFFDVTPNFDKHKFLNDNVLGSDSGTILTCPETMLEENRPRSDPSIFKRRRVKWFCVGNGAENLTQTYTSWPAHDTDIKLFNMIPFRLRSVDDDLQPADAANYRFKVRMTIKGAEYYAYYFKKIEFPDNTGVKLLLDGVDHTPQWRDSVPDLNAEVVPPYSYADGKNLQISIQFNLSLGNGELQEWFTVVDNTLANARFSEIGLVCGLECDRTLGIKKIITASSSAADIANAEVWSAELASHLTISSQSVASPGYQILFTYFVFA